MKNAITVIDSLMGSGKTSWAIQYMNEHPEKSFIYVTPYLDEVKRIKTSVKEHNIQSPEYYKGKPKLDDLKRLLLDCADIAMSHSLFMIMDNDCIQYIKDDDYTIIVDEALKVVQPYQRKHKDDIRWLFDCGYITSDEDGWISWNPEKQGIDTSFNEIMILANRHCLVKVSDTEFIWKWSPEIFNGDNEVFIMTYMFEASYMDPYFKTEGIEYNIKSIMLRDGRYELSPYYDPDLSKYKELITIYDSGYAKKKPNTQSFKGRDLSKHWYDTRKNSPRMDVLRKSVQTFLRRRVNSKACEMMWTTFSDSKYKKALHASQIKLSSNAFVSCNARGTNDFADRFNLVYLVNRYTHPSVQHYFANYGIDIDWSKDSLSEMIQWIWRSRIRNDEPINILIPSDRMRNLLEEWINK